MLDRDWWKTSHPSPLLALKRDDEESGLEDDDDGGEGPSK
jgi:hypothetical protein